MYYKKNRNYTRQSETAKSRVTPCEERQDCLWVNPVEKMMLVAAMQVYRCLPENMHDENVQSFAEKIAYWGGLASDSPEMRRNNARRAQ